MDMKNVIVAICIIVIVLALITLIPSESEAGTFIMPSIIGTGIIVFLIILSIFTIVAIIVTRNKSYYPY